MAECSVKKKDRQITFDLSKTSGSFDRSDLTCRKVRHIETYGCGILKTKKIRKRNSRPGERVISPSPEKTKDQFDPNIPAKKSPIDENIELSVLLSDCCSSALPDLVVSGVPSACPFTSNVHLA